MNGYPPRISPLIVSLLAADIGHACRFYWTMGGIPIGFLKDGAVGLAKATSSGNVNSIGASSVVALLVPS